MAPAKGAANGPKFGHAPMSAPLPMGPSKAESASESLTIGTRSDGVGSFPEPGGYHSTPADAPRDDFLRGCGLEHRDARRKGLGGCARCFANTMPPQPVSRGGCEATRSAQEMGPPQANNIGRDIQSHPPSISTEFDRPWPDVVPDSVRVFSHLARQSIKILGRRRRWKYECLEHVLTNPFLVYPERFQLRPGLCSSNFSTKRLNSTAKSAQTRPNTCRLR